MWFSSAVLTIEWNLGRFEVRLHVWLYFAGLSGRAAGLIGDGTVLLFEQGKKD